MSFIRKTSFLHSTLRHAQTAYALVVTLGLISCSNCSNTNHPSNIERYKVEVLKEYPHDPQAFTQGLIWVDGKLFESTGQYGQSSLREVILQTGQISRKVENAPSTFSEGLAKVDDKLIQLTWKNHQAFVWDLDTFERIETFDYPGEGWGLCFNGSHLVMSDGTDFLSFRDPETFELQKSIRITELGQPLRWINELECVRGKVFANIWQQERIVEIDPETGRVISTIDASGLLTAQEKQNADVLNGIAWITNTDRFIITGKNWPKTYEVRWVSEDE